MALTFDHGGTLPLADQLIVLVQELLADLTGLDDDAVPSNEFGPVLRSVEPIPWNVKNLLIRGGERGHAVFREIVARNAPPCAMIFAGGRVPTDSANPATSTSWMSEDFDLFVYLVDSHRAGEMVGRYTPDGVSDKKPGLHAMDDLVLSRLANTADEQWQSLVYRGLEPLFAMPDFSIHEIRFTAQRNWLLCRPRNPDSIDEVEATHDDDAAGVIAVQKVFSA